MPDFAKSRAIYSVGNTFFGGKTMNETVNFGSVESKVITLRDRPVILDSDVAELYGVETREVNQAIKNNPEKFPEGYIIELAAEEWQIMKSKFLISLSAGGKVKLPKAFTEKGLYMLATILKGERAIQTTIAIVDAFAKMRELTRTMTELSQTTDENAKRSLMQKSSGIIADLLGDEMETTDSETSIEINLALMKFKHTIKQKKK
jgi:phage regulator Rha-like protein